MPRWRASAARSMPAAAATIGATGRPLPALAPLPAAAPAGYLELAVVGAHLSGMALNHELRSAGGIFLRAVETEPCLRSSTRCRAVRRSGRAWCASRPAAGACHRHRGVGAARGRLRPLRCRHPRAARHRHAAAGRRHAAQGLPVRGRGDPRGQGHLRRSAAGAPSWHPKLEAQTRRCNSRGGVSRGLRSQSGSMKKHSTRASRCPATAWSKIVSDRSASLRSWNMNLALELLNRAKIHASAATSRLKKSNSIRSDPALADGMAGDLPSWRSGWGGFRRLGEQADRHGARDILCHQL